MQPIVRALAMLRYVAAAPAGVSLSDVSHHLDIPLASAHRTINVLEDEGFVARSTTNRRYFIGPMARELGDATYTRESPLVTTHEAVDRVARETGETVFLSAMVGRQVVCLALRESRHQLRLFVGVGQSMPFHASAAARVVLAWQDTRTVQDLLGNGPLRPFTADTDTSPEQVLTRLRTVRSQGFDTCERELDEDAWAVAAPVRSSTGDVVASVTLVAPSQRLGTERRRDAMTRTIMVAAHEMSADLGWSQSAEKSGDTRPTAAGPADVAGIG